MLLKQEKTLTARAVAYLARREYSRQELFQKLRGYLQEGQSVDDIDAVLDRLQEKGYLSDERYAQVRARVRSDKFGNRRIANELRDKGIKSEQVQAALNSIGESEFDRAWRVWQRKYSHCPQDAKEKARQIRYLAYRGFTFDVITQVLQQAQKEENN